MTSSIAQKHFNEAEKFKDNRVYEKAVESYKKAIEADPLFVDAHYNLAVSYIHIKQLDNAVACFHRVIDIDPQDCTAYNNLGVIFHNKGLLDDAEKRFLEALKINPEYSEARENLTQCTIQNGKKHAVNNNLTEAGKKILIVMDQGIGNMIMLTPALKTIKEQIPNCKITVLGKQPALQVLSNWYVVEKTISALDNDSYDICFLSIWSGDYEDHYLDKLKKQCKQIIKMSIGNLDVHETKHHLEIAGFLGCRHTDIETYCSSIDVDIPLPRNKKIIGISDTATPHKDWERKRWPYYKELANILIQKGYTVILLGGTEEAKRYNPGEWHPEVINCMGKYTIQETAGLIKKCHKFVGNDSGPAHMAAALGVDAYVIFGSTRISKNKPYGTNVTVISKYLPCSPCQNTPGGLLCNDWKCVNEITVNDVIGIVLRNVSEQDGYNYYKENTSKFYIEPKSQETKLAKLTTCDNPLVINEQNIKNGFDVNNIHCTSLKNNKNKVLLVVCLYENNFGDILIYKTIDKKLRNNGFDTEIVEISKSLNESKLIERANNSKFLYFVGGGIIERWAPEIIRYFDVLHKHLLVPYGVIGLSTGNFVYQDMYVSLKAFADKAMFFYTRDEDSILTFQKAGASKLPTAGVDVVFANADIAAFNRYGNAISANFRNVPYPDVTGDIEWQKWSNALRNIGVQFLIRDCSDTQQSLEIPINSDDELSAIRKSAFVVSMRFHVILVAALTGVLPVPINYCPKVRRLAKQLGIEEYCLELHDHHKLESIFTRLKSNENIVRKNLGTRISELRMKANEIIDDSIQLMETICDAK